MPKYKFIKDSNLEVPRNVSEVEYHSVPYGQEFEYQPKDVPLRVYHFSGSVTGSDEYRILHSLKNTINYYSANDELFNYSNFYNTPSTLLAFSSLHVGSGIEYGSIKINMYVSGALTASCSDFRQDGVLYDQNDNKIGAVLYREGFILINNTASIGNEVYGVTTQYNNFNDNLRWIHAFSEAGESVYFDIEYLVDNQVSTNTFFVYADKNQLNHSNNITYIETGSYYSMRGDNYFIENTETKVKKTNKSPFVSGSATFEKQTFITNIGLYDKDKKLIGVASLANPVRKTENREYLFKLRIDT